MGRTCQGQPGVTWMQGPEPDRGQGLLTQDSNPHQELGGSSVRRLGPSSTSLCLEKMFHFHTLRNFRKTLYCTGTKAAREEGTLLFYWRLMTPTPGPSQESDPGRNQVQVS